MANRLTSKTVAPHRSAGGGEIESRSRGAAVCILPRDSGEGGPRSCAVGGASRCTQVWPRKRTVASHAPSTALRAVPLPVFTGEDEQSRSRGASLSPSPRWGEGWGEGVPSLKFKPRSPSPSLTAFA
jgi:hypothetical protein